MVAREVTTASRLVGLAVAVSAVIGLLSASASAERWLIETAPIPGDLPAGRAALVPAAELLLRADLAEFRGVTLLTKADVKSDIVTLELNRLASATGDARALLGIFARAKGLLVIEFALRGEGIEMRLTAKDLALDEGEKTTALLLAETGLEEKLADAAAWVGESFGRNPSADEKARMKQSRGLTAEALDAAAKSTKAATLEERETLAKQAAKLAPKSALAQFLLAQALHAEGKTLEAISAYREANRLDGAQPLYHYDLGNAFFDDKRYDEAIVEYERAIALDPAHVESHENFLRAQAAKGAAPDAALAAYRKIAEAHAGAALVHLNIGRLLARMGKLDEAIAEFHRAGDLDTTDAVAHFDLAHALEQALKEDEAFYEYKEAVKRSPNYAKAHNNLGRLYEKRGKLDLALYWYTQAVKYAPDYALAWSNLGILYGKRDMNALEIEAFKQQARLTPGDPVAYYNLGVALQRSGDAKSAIVQLKKAIELSPDDKPSHWQLAHAYERAGMMNLAADEWKKVLALKPTPEEKATAEKHLKDIP